MLKQREGLEFDSKQTSGAFLMKVVLEMAETSIFWPSSQEELAKLRPISVVDTTLNQNHRDLTQYLLGWNWGSWNFSKGRFGLAKENLNLSNPKKQLSGELWAHPLPSKSLVFLTSLWKCRVAPLSKFLVPISKFMETGWDGKKWLWASLCFPETIKPRLCCRWTMHCSTAEMHLSLLKHQQQSSAAQRASWWS